jgi:hypothetical protein
MGQANHELAENNSAGKAVHWISSDQKRSFDSTCRTSEEQAMGSIGVCLRQTEHYADSRRALVIESWH